MIKRAVIFTAAMAMVCTSTISAPQAQETTSQQRAASVEDPLRPLLASIDTMPADITLLEAISPTIRGDLEGAADHTLPRASESTADPARSLYERRRALLFLSHWPDARTRAWLEQSMVDEAMKPLRSSTVYLLARAYGQPGDEGLVALVDTATRDEDPEVRDRAVRALRWIDHVEAGRVLETLRYSPDGDLRHLAEHTLRRRDKRLGATAASPTPKELPR